MKPLPRAVLQAHIVVAALAFLFHRAIEKKLKAARLDLSATEALTALKSVPVVDIDQLREEAGRRAGSPRRKPEAAGGRVVAVVEYRDGTVIDVVRQAGRDEDAPAARAPSGGDEDEVGAIA